MSLNLMIDTSFTYMVSLVESEKNLAIDSIFTDNPNSHFEKLTIEIKKLLDRNNKSIKDIEGVIVGVGPGPFTGLRIGLAVAKAISFSNNINCIGISSLDAEAQALAKDIKCGEFIAVANNAKRNQLYYALYKKKDGDSCVKISKACDYKIVRIDGLKESLESLGNKNKYHLVTNAYKLYKNEFDNLFTKIYSTSFQNNSSAIAMNELASDKSFSFPVQPLYLKRPDIN